MKIRVMGTAEECKIAKSYYKQIGKDKNVKSLSVSEPYANRNSINLYRIYIDIEYKETTEPGNRAITE